MKRLITFILPILLVFTLVACSKEISFEESCWKQVKDCETTALGDGTVSVSLSAPDYVALLEYLAETGVDDELTVEMLADAAKDNPNAVKEYTFVVESADEEAIREALMEQIAYEMLVLAMGDYVG